MGKITLDHDPTVEGVIAGRMDETSGYRTIRNRGSASWLLFVTNQGQGRWTTENESGQTGPNEALLLPPLQAQDYGATAEGWGFYWIHFHPPATWADLLEWRKVSFTDERIEPRVRDLLDLSRTDLRLAMNALEEILIRLAPPTEPHREPRIESALGYIAAHLDGALDIPTLAARAGLSDDRFSRLFAAEVRQPPRAYIEARRLDHAERLLAATSLPVARIAEACGFAHPFYFTARFKNRHGVAPTSWRKGREPLP
ncbi:helix-turn-helix domain-containing protein [soil metagenome]